MARQWDPRLTRSPSRPGAAPSTTASLEVVAGVSAARDGGSGVQHRLPDRSWARSGEYDIQNPERSAERVAPEASVVIVADHPDRASAAVRALRAEGYPVPDAVHGAQLEARLAAGVIVTLEDGLDRALELCRWLRVRALAATILLFAAADGPGAALEAGAEFWSDKWDPALLGLQVRLIAQRGYATSTPQEPALRVVDGGMQLHGAPIRISGRPLRFAAYLIRRAVDRLDRERSGTLECKDLELVTRDELAVVVWHRKFVGANSFDKAASAVRTELYPEGRRLRSIKGLGYWIQIM